MFNLCFDSLWQRNGKQKRNRLMLILAVSITKGKRVIIDTKKEGASWVSYSPIAINIIYDGLVAAISKLE